jgi:hypothetical protein
MTASIRASSSISISKSSAESDLWATASPGDVLASRVAFVQVLADQRKESAVAFLEAAVAYFAKLGVRLER